MDIEEYEEEYEKFKEELAKSESFLSKAEVSPSVTRCVANPGANATKRGVPNSVNIGGQYYKIGYVPNLNDDTRILMGQISYVKHEIHLNSSLGMDAQCEVLTLLHEIFHGIREASGQTIEDEERVIELFARGMYQVLKDNNLESYVKEAANNKN